MIRPYREEDLPIIMDIGNRAWQGIYDSSRQCRGQELFDLLVSDAATAKGEEVRYHCRTSPESVFVCREQGRIVGFITFIIRADKKIGEIGNNAVDPRCGLKGIGQQMYRAVFEHFRRQGLLYAKVQTGLDEAHARARRAYERAGFGIRQEDVTYYMKL